MEASEIQLSANGPPPDGSKHGAALALNVK